MSTKQTAFFLADYAMSNSLTLNPLAFTSDGTFFAENSDETITRSLFGCRSERSECRNLLDSIRTSLSTQFPLHDTAQLQKSFSAEYLDPNNVVNDFLSYVQRCAVSYRQFGSEFFAPYIALVQSSGSGKTRLLRECADLLPTLYVCFRTGSGYPPYTTNAIASLFENLGRTNSLDASISLMVGRLRRAEISARINLPRPGFSCADYDESKPEFPSDQLSHVWNLDDIDLISNIPASDCVVILVLDEARWLLDGTPQRDRVDNQGEKGMCR